MKIQIRENVFETNSSSCHTFSYVSSCSRIPTFDQAIEHGDTNGYLVDLTDDIPSPEACSVDGLWLIRDKILTIVRSYYPFYRDCHSDKENELDLIQEICIDKKKLLAHKDWIAFNEALNEYIKEHNLTFPDGTPYKVEYKTEDGTKDDFFVWRSTSSRDGWESTYIFDTLSSEDAELKDLLTYIPDFIFDLSLVLTTSEYMDG